MLTICPNADTLASTAADLIITTVQQAIERQGRCALALTGGSTPERTYQLLAQPERQARIDWSRLHVFVGDERFVPFDDPRSNYGMARRSVLDRVPVPAAQVYPIPTNLASPAVAADAYTQTLATAFALPPDGPPPRFDLLLLGLGDDGHIASLFPGHPTLTEVQRWVTWSPPGTLPPPVDRVTLMFPVLNAARHVLFLVAGANKAPALRDVLGGGAAVNDRPAAGVRPTDGTLTWLLDEAAAGLLARKS